MAFTISSAWQLTARGEDTATRTASVTATPGDQAIGVVMWRDAATTLSSATVGTDACTLGTKYDGGDQEHIQFFWMPNLTVSGTQTVTATMSGTTSRIDMGVAIVNGGDTADFAGPAGSDPVSWTTTLDVVLNTVAANSLILAAAITNDGALTEDTGETPDYVKLTWSTSVYDVSSGAYTLDSGAAGNKTVTMTSASSGDGFIAAIAFNLAASSTQTQEGYRWRLDDGDEANATWAVAQDTGITAPANATRRLRVLIDTSGDANATQYQLEFKEANDANYTKVT